MTITERLRTEFPGITVMLVGFVGALRAYRKYKKALNAMEALKIKNPGNAWILNVAHHSTLSYSEALSIYEYLSKYSTAFKQTPMEITEFVIKMTNCGRTGGMITVYLKLMDSELDRWARDKLSMHY